MTAGPEMATRYILAQETSEFWTDGLWSDGGLVLDLVAHRLLFFGDEIMTTMNERRAMLQVLEIVWPGYSISWAYGATAEIAASVGAPITVGQQCRVARCGPLITAPALDVGSGAAEAQVRLKERIFQRYEDSPAGQLSRLAELLVTGGLPGRMGAL